MLSDLWSHGKAEVRQKPHVGEYASESSAASAGQTISVVMQEIKPDPVVPSLYDVWDELKAVRRDMQFMLVQQAKGGLRSSASEASSFSGGPHVDENMLSLQRLIDNAFTKHRLLLGASEKGSNQLAQELEKVVSERLRDQTSAICAVLRQLLADELQNALKSSSAAQLAETEEKLMEEMRRYRLPLARDPKARRTPRAYISHSLSSSASQLTQEVPTLPTESTVAVFTPYGKPPTGKSPSTKQNGVQDTSSSSVFGSRSAEPRKSITHAAFIKSWSSDVRNERKKYFHVEWLSKIVFTLQFKVFRCVFQLVNLYFIGRLGSDDMQDLLLHHNIKADWSFMGVPTAVIVPGGASTGWDVRNNNFRPAHWQETVLLCLFSVITFLTFMANPYWFVVGHGWAYNVLDLAVCIVVCLDFCISALLGHPNSHYLPNLTFILFLRIAHDLFQGTKSGITSFVRHMIKGAVHSLGVVWLVVILLGALCYSYGIILTHGAYVYLSTKEAGELSEGELIAIAEGYGSIPIATILLFMSISGGTDWKDVLVPLGNLPSIYTILAVGFITFAILGVLNVVTGMFVDFALSVTQGNKNEQVAKTLSQQAKWEQQIKRMFTQADRDGSGSLTWEEFSRYLEHPVIIAYFHSLQLDPSEAKGLFTLLDIAGTGEIDTDEFVKGCTQLKGEAKSLDLASLRFEFLRFARKSRQEMKLISSTLAKISESLLDDEQDDVSTTQTPRADSQETSC